MALADRSVRLLVELFERNGCVRTPDFKKRKRLRERYKKGYEIRFIANTKSELRLVRRLLRRLHLKPGRPHVKRTQFVQPVYGKATVQRLVTFLEKA